MLNFDMPIYTKTGDKGETSLYHGKRVSKSNSKIEALGGIDELTSFIGLVSLKIKKKDKKLLQDIQKDLYKIMSYLSEMNIDLSFLKNRVKDFENKINKLDKKLPKLTKFIIPGGTELSAWFHILRTVCRRCERLVVKLQTRDYMLDLIQYLNRLSDLFFTLARFYSRGKEVQMPSETPENKILNIKN